MNLVNMADGCLSEVKYVKSIISAGDTDSNVKMAEEGLARAIQGLRTSIRNSDIPIVNRTEFDRMVGGCMGQVTIIRSAFTNQEALSVLNQLQGHLTSIRSLLLRFA